MKNESWLVVVSQDHIVVSSMENNMYNVNTHICQLYLDYLALGY